MAELAGIIREGVLIPESEWRARVTALKAQVPKIRNDKEPNLKLVRDALVSAVEQRILLCQTLKQKQIGILLSGGVDSTLLAFLAKDLLPKGMELISYTAGIKTKTRVGQDLKWAELAAKRIDIPLRKRTLTLDELEEWIQGTVNVLSKASVTVNAVSVGVGAVIMAAGEAAQREKIKHVFSGIGPEEIFAGYRRHARASDVDEECWSGLYGMWERDLTRDYAVSSALGISLLVPFLDGKVIRSAMSLHPEWKIRNEYKKWALRKIAEELGLPKGLAWRKKKAAQYGSGINKSLLKIAKRHGFRYRRDYLTSLIPRQ